MTAAQIFSVILTAILTENFVLCKFLGICPFLGVSKKVDTALGMSVAVIFVMLISTAVTYPINKFILVANDMAYLQTIVFILVIAALVQLVEIGFVEDDDLRLVLNKTADHRIGAADRNTCIEKFDDNINKLQILLDHTLCLCHMSREPLYNLLFHIIFL